MTISSTTRKAGPFSGNDVTVDFPFAFKVFSSTDVLVVEADSLGTEATLALTTDYTVALNVDQNASPGGTVTLNAALATGYTLVVTSDIEPLQGTDLTNMGGFFPAVVTNAFDKLTILIQQLTEKVSRSLRTAITTPSGFNAELPTPVAYQFIAFNGTADGFDAVDATGTTALSADLAASGGSALIGFLQSGTGAVSRTAQSKMREFVSVKDFGATGDGTTDDTAAIQAAIDRISTTGGTVYCPAGTYKITTTIDISDLGDVPITIKGDGHSISTSFPTDGTIFYGLTATKAVFEVQGTQSITFEDVTIASKSGDANKSVIGIYISRTAGTQSAQFQALRRVGINIATSTLANGGKGSIAIYNVAGEHGLFEHCMFRGDTAMYLTELDAVPYVPVYAASNVIASCTLNTFIQVAFNSWSLCGVELRGVMSTDFIDCYWGNDSGAGNLDAAILLTQSTSNYHENISFGGQCENYDCFISHDTNYGARRLRVNVTIGGLVAPADYLFRNKGTTPQIYDCELNFTNPSGYALSLYGSTAGKTTGFIGGKISIPPSGVVNAPLDTLYQVAIHDQNYTPTAITGLAGSSWTHYMRDATYAQVTYGKIHSGGFVSSGEIYLMETTASLPVAFGIAAGTLTNAPKAGNPDKWIKINDNGTDRLIPSWTF